MPRGAVIGFIAAAVEGTTRCGAHLDTNAAGEAAAELARKLLRRPG
jgi:hypothetical protein